MNKFIAQKRISIVWFTFAALIGTLLLFMTLNNKFGTQSGEIWKWYSTMILPSLTLILTTFIAGMQNTAAPPQIDKFYFYLSFFFSLFYLLILLIIVLYTPFADSAITLFGNSVTYLAIFQGLVTSTLGLFFAKGS
ncbi:hypothetical protein ECE50_008570 [Chitinophaga sp. Mgbs1]|uniref:Uncharacterized protein n=1 Tax=Chitinophaga solisilvae TaxID=1233460 RepID=A0A433WQ85_9BACT|nr:hypothetical protein [Chitinophaga solisilvae]